MTNSENLIIQANILDKDMRLDLFLRKKLDQYSRAQINKYIKMGLFESVNNKIIKASNLIQGHEEFVFKTPELASSEIKPENIKLDIIFSDKYLAIINKPAGLVVHPGAGVKSGTLCHALLYYFPDLEVGDKVRPGIVHRLDKNTSGLIIIAKTHEAHNLLSKLFVSKKIKKIYQVISYGKFDQTKFDLHTGHVRHPRNKLKFFTNLAPPKIPNSPVRAAHTSFKILAQKWDLSIIEAELHTGRTHQIRAHLADIGHPIIGDKLYGGQRELAKHTPEKLRDIVINLDRQALHAYSLSFVHPIINKPVNFTAPLPNFMSKITQLIE